MFNVTTDYGRSPSNQGDSGGDSGMTKKRRDSAVLSMPKMFRPTELQYTSPITKFQTFRVEDNTGTEQEFFMKAIKNPRCVQVSLRHELEKNSNYDHPHLAKVTSINFTDHYSYIVFQKPKGEPIFEGKKQIYKERECRRIIYQLARAIQYTHANGNVHRDLRDANVFVDYPKHKDYKPNVTLVDFGITKTLQADQKLAILDDGSGFPSGHVRYKNGQYPAPEVLMDLRIDRNADAWFIGILIFRMICGKIPFDKTEDNEDIREAICNNLLSFDHENWVHISAPLDNLVRGLLHKDPKRRYTIDQIFWSKWIRKLKYNNIAKIATSYWLEKYKLEIPANTMVLIESYSSFGLTSIQLPHYPDEPQFDKRISKQFKQRKKLERKHKTQLTFHNDSCSVVHQTKLFDLQHDFISAECNITISSNVWCSKESNPMIFEFRLDYVKDDIFIGIITDQYESAQSFTHHIGGNDESMGVSLRECIAYFNGKSMKSLQRSDYLNTSVKNSIYNNSNNSNLNRSSNDANDANNANGMKSTNPAAQVYNLQTSRTSVIADNIGLSWLNKTNNKMSGPPPIRNTTVRMRIDYESRNISLFVGDRDVLDPLNFEFSGKVTAAFTLTHCLDQVTLKNVEMELSP